jgi:hypothetical protein
MSGAGAQGPVEVTFAYTEDEYISAARLFSTRRRHPGFERALALGFAAAVALLLALAGDPFVACVVVGSLLLSAAAGYYGERVRPRRAFRRDPKFRDPYSVRFAEEGIGVRSKDFEARFDWDYYPKVVETPDFLYFVYADEMFFLVPKRALRERGQEAALGEMLRRKLGAKVERHGLPEARAREAEYVPPREPPDWR